MDSRNALVSETGAAPAPARGTLYIDLDRALLPSGLAAECLVEAIHHAPLAALRLPLWALRGTAYVKNRLARHAALDVSKLPYRAEVLSDLRQKAGAGVALVLVTSADESVANEVAAYLGIFSGVVASSVAAPLRSNAKREAMRRRGDSAAGEYAIERPRFDCLRLLRTLRPRHWLKNLLVFLPFLLAHDVRSLRAWALACVAFGAFSLCASFGYVLNDIVDRGQDRLHPRRHLRPIAAGEVSLQSAFGLLLILFVLTAAPCVLLPWQSIAVLVWYLGATTFYTLLAKKYLMADVIVLALLYTSRLLMGAFATGNTVSPWLASFSLMLALSLALCKRVSELITWLPLQSGAAPGRKYNSGDIPILEMMAVSSGFVACLIMVLYLQSEAVLKLYRNPHYLWVGVVGLLYWLGRLVMWTHRGKCPDDPLFFMVQDKATLPVVIVAGVCWFLAI